MAEAIGLVKKDLESMDNVKAIVLRAAGINCDMETEYALQLAGSQVERVHINRVIDNPSMLEGCQILVFPGGFSYGDDVAAGKVLANQVVHHLSDMLVRCAGHRPTFTSRLAGI